MSKRNVPKAQGKQPAARSQSAQPKAKPTSAINIPSAQFWWVGLLAAAMGFILYGNTFGHQYCLDDYSIIKDNWVVQGGLKNLGTIFSTEYRYGAWGSPGSLYRPLTLTMMAIEWQLAPDNPFLGHFLNVVFYAMTGWVLWITLRRVMVDYSPILPALATLFFMAHPVHTEVVGNIKSRDEIVALLLSIGAIYAIWRYFEQENRKWLVLAVLAYTLSIFTKESVITFLAVIPLTIWFFTNKSLGQNLRISALFLAPALIFLLIRHNVLAAQPYPEAYSILDNFIIGAKNQGERFASAFMMCGRYLQALVWPQPLVSDLGYPQMKPVGFGDWRALLGFALYVGMGAWALWGMTKKHFLAYAILLYLVTFSLFSNVLMLIGTSYGERELYDPSLGFAMALAWLLAKIGRIDLRGSELFPKPGSNMVWGAAVVILLLYSGKTIQRNPAWFDSFSLYMADVGNSPNCAKLHYHLGLEETKRGIDDKNGGTVNDPNWVKKGIDSYNKAIELFPEYHDAYGSRGLAYFRLQDYDRAFTDYQRALKHRPNDARVLSNLGYIYFMRNDLENAELVYRKSVASDPRFVDARRNLGAVLAMRKEYDQAIEQWKEGLKYEANSAILNFYIGSAYRDSGRPELAAPWLNTAYQLDPNLKK